MLRGKEKFITQLYILSDIIVIQIAFFLAWIVRFYIFKDVNVQNLPMGDYFIWNTLYVILYLIVAFFVSLYVPKRKKSFANEAYKLVQASSLAMFGLLSIFFVMRVVDISRWYLVAYFLIATTLLLMYRYIVKRSLRNLRIKGYNKQFILIIGAGKLGKKFYHEVQVHQEYGFDIIGFLDDNRTSFNEAEKVNKPILGKLDYLNEIIEEKLIDEVVIALPLTAYEKYQTIIATCEKAGVRVTIIPDYYDILPANPHFENFGDLPVINVRDIPLDDMVNRTLKRGFDIMFALIAIILISPILIFVALGVKLTSPGPILFKQERVGYNRRTFMMYKFRSMKQMDSSASDTQWTVENDPRRTKFGTFIRKTSLDELPQFFNVLLGDMSVVGPRPERPYFVDQFKEEIPKYMIKHQVRPGITGLAQVEGYRGDTSISKRIECDIHYLENWTLLFDIKILLKTIVNGFINKNAY